MTKRWPRAGFHDVTQAVEHLAQRIGALTARLRKQHEIGRDQRPFIVRNIGRVRFARLNHPVNLRFYRYLIPNSR